MELTTSVLTEGFSVRRPIEGFDRLNANRTNYSLGEVARDFSTATAELQMTHPKDQPAVVQPAIGGEVSKKYTGSGGRGTRREAVRF